jgi:ATP-dependent Clp protease ATP-binding subunit ClpA
MFERFHKSARDAVIQAQREARELRHGWVGTEHILLALVAEPDAAGVQTLVRLGVDADACRAAVTAVVQPDEGLAGDDAEALHAFGIDLDEVRRRAERAFGEGALEAPRDADERRMGPLRRRRRLGPDDRGPGHIPFAHRAKKALEIALREAIARKDRHIGTEHLVLALLRSDDKITAAVFDRLGLDRKAVRSEVDADLRKAA